MCIFEQQIENMSVDVTEITNLAKILHEDGENVLNGSSKLSLDATVLENICKEFSNFCDNGVSDGGRAFEVLSQHHGESPLVHHLEFLHDFFQKTLSLKIVGNSSEPLSDDKIDLSKFKKLKYLELKRVPIKHLVGLKVIQPYIECIICEKGLTALEHLLAECGSDNSTGFVWSELKEAVLSFNSLKVVDTSVAFAPWLQLLDLSHNQINDVKAIECLPNLKYVNLSYNSLKTIPVFNKSARKKIEVLVLKYNYIADLIALSDLHYLRELDLSNNWINSTNAFRPFLNMFTLHWLSLRDNPVSFRPNYRTSVIEYLHISASFGNFVLDKISLTKKERTRVGLKLTTHPLERHCTLAASASCSVDTPGVQIESGEVVLLPEKPSGRSGKVRLAVIPNLDDGTYDGLASDLSVLNVQEINNDHLIMKREIESARQKYGENWLRGKGGEEVQNILRLPQSHVSSTPYDESWLAAILEEVSTEAETNMISSTSDNNAKIVTAVVEPVPSDCESIDEKIQSVRPDESFLSCMESSNYFSMESSTETPKQSKETSPDIETILDSSEDREDESQERLYLVTRCMKPRSEHDQLQLFLSITPTEVLEKEIEHGRVVSSWSLSSVKNVTRPRDHEIHLVFDTVRRDKWERIYVLDASEAKELYEFFRTELEARALEGRRQILYNCITCAATFIVEKNSRKENVEDKIGCLVCKSKMVLRTDETSSDSDKQSRSGKPKLSGKHSHNRSASTGVVDSIISKEMNKCSSQSSIEELTASPPTEVSKESSVASLDDKRHMHPAILSVLEKKCESDIEIISNPSQSSIEVIEGPLRHLRTVSPLEQFPFDEKQPLPKVVTQLSAFSALTESSSSGSVTDSMCTAYENSSMVSSGASKKSALESSVLVEDPVAKSLKKSASSAKEFQDILGEVLENVNTQKPKRRGMPKDVDMVEYSYSDFQWLDHRIKLYLYVHLFEDNYEEFIFLIRGQVLLLGADHSFEACVVSSNKKIYVLKVTGTEEGEEASKFLSKVDELSIKLTNIKKWGTLPFYQGFSVSCRSNPSEYLILLKNPMWTMSFLHFLTTKGSVLPEHVEWSADAITDPNLHLLLESADNSKIEHVAFFNSCKISEDASPGIECQEGALIVTPSDLFIISSLKWLLNTNNKNTPTSIAALKLSDLIQAGISDKELRLQYLREAYGKQGVWAVTLADDSVVTRLISSIQEAWEELFPVPLHVTKLNDNCFST